MSQVSEARAQQLGFLLTRGYDDIRDGDDAITANAARSAELLDAMTARVDAVTDTAAANKASAAGLRDYGAKFGQLVIDPKTGTHVLDAAGELAITIDPTADGASVVVHIMTGATLVTFPAIIWPSGEAPISGDALSISAQRIRGVWFGFPASGALEASTDPGGPPDAIAPTPPTLTVSALTSTSATITASNATDNEAVTGYRWSRTGAAPWSPTAGPNYVMAGLSASSPYEITAQARDRAGNWSSPTSLQFASADPPPGWSVVALDNFDSPDAPTIAGRSLAGGAIWGLATTGQIANNVGAISIVGNRAVLTGSGTREDGYFVSVPGPVIPNGIRASFDYSLIATGGSSCNPQLFIRYRSTNYASVQLVRVSINVDGRVGISAVGDDNASLSVQGSFTGYSSVSNLMIEVKGTAIILKIGGIQALTATLPGTLSNIGIGLSLLANGTMVPAIDNFKLERFV